MAGHEGSMPIAEEKAERLPTRRDSILGYSMAASWPPTAEPQSPSAGLTRLSGLMPVNQG